MPVRAVRLDESTHGAHQFPAILGQQRLQEALLRPEHGWNDFASAIKQSIAVVAVPHPPIG